MYAWSPPVRQVCVDEHSVQLGGVTAGMTPADATDAYGHTDVAALLR